VIFKIDTNHGRAWKTSLGGVTDPHLFASSCSVTLEPLGTGLISVGMNRRV
jgi:hypothetical protein